MGLRLAADGDGRLAGPPLRTAFDLNRTDPAVGTALGEILTEAGRLRDAFQVLAVTVEQHPRFAPGRMALGRLHRRRGSYHLAAREFEAVTALRNDYPDAWHELAICYLQMQQVDKAGKAIDLALAAAPDEPEYLMVRAAVSTAVGDRSAAAAAMARAAAAQPRSASLRARYATMLLDQYEDENDLRKAEQLLAELRELDPEHLLLPYLQGQLALHKGRWAEAVMHLEKAASTSPGQDEVYYALSQAYRRTGRAKEADLMLSRYRSRQSLRRRIDELRIRLAVETEHIPLYLQLADLQQQQGDRAAAAATLETALQRDPDSREINRRLTALRASAGR